MSTDPAIDAIRRDRAALEAEIRTAGSTIRGTSCQCPHPDHDDGKPSASIHDDGDAWRVYCWSRQCFGTTGDKPKGADVFDLRSLRTGRPVADVLAKARGAASPATRRESPRTASTPKPGPDFAGIAKRAYAALSDEQRQALGDELGLSADALRRMRCGWITAASLATLDTTCKGEGTYTFPMRDASNAIVGIRLRTTEGFKYAIAGSDGGGIFIPVDLAGDGTLYIGEGPTDVAAKLDMGADAVGRPSNNTGADAIVAYIQRHPRDAVAIVTDHDPKPETAAATGQAAEALAKRLAPLVGSVRIIRPPEPHKDVRAWRIAGAGLDDLEALVDEAPSRGPAAELRTMIEDEISGKRSAIPFPWPLVSRGTQALLPGNVVVLCGDPGDGKSLWLLQALAYWHDHGIRAAIYALEQSRAYHLKRALAQRVGASWLTDVASVKQRPDEAMAYHDEHERWSGEIGRCIWDAPDKPVSLADLLGWIEARAAEGARIIAIDPITNADTTDRPWDDARRFLSTVKPILDSYNASLVLVTHARKGKQRGTPVTLDDLAGGAGWARFTQCVLWMEKHDEPKRVNVKNIGDAMPIAQAEEINRTLRIMKARDGRSAGWQLAFDFDPQTLRFHERGAIVKNRQNSEV